MTAEELEKKIIGLEFTLQETLEKVAYMDQMIKSMALKMYGGNAEDPAFKNLEMLASRSVALVRGRKL